MYLYPDHRKSKPSRGFPLPRFAGGAEARGDHLRLRCAQSPMGKGGRSDPPLVAAAAAAAAAEDEQLKPVWSSGVPFYPPSSRYWRIGGEWYDLEPFLDKHPGTLVPVLDVAAGRACVPWP